MPPPQPFGREPLTRADLPEVLTPDTVRRMDMRTVRRLSRPGNGVLSADDQRAFDEALRQVMQGTTDRLDQTLRRARPTGPPVDLDPELRRSYMRTRARLATQARRTQENFPQLTSEWGVPTEPADPPPAEVTGAGSDDDVSLGTFESEIEQTSDTLEILERIASMQLQQLEHQRSQLLRDVRGLFFALLVSVAVIVAGVAPLVEAAPDKRRQILIWTLVVCGLAGLVYAVVRAAQSRRSPPTTSVGDSVGAVDDASATWGDGAAG